MTKTITMKKFTPTDSHVNGVALPKKPKAKKFDVISPDGFAIHPTDTYSTHAEALEAFEAWKKGYEAQGYYSSTSFGRIPLDWLRPYCKIVELPENSELDGLDFDLDAEGNRIPGTELKPF